MATIDDYGKMRRKALVAGSMWRPSTGRQVFVVLGARDFSFGLYYEVFWLTGPWISPRLLAGDYIVKDCHLVSDGS